MRKKTWKTNHTVLCFRDFNSPWSGSLRCSRHWAKGMPVRPIRSFHISCPVFRNIIPFALGDLFIALSIGGMIAYPFYARIRLKLSWKKILREGMWNICYGSMFGSIWHGDSTIHKRIFMNEPECHILPTLPRFSMNL